MFKTSRRQPPDSIPPVRYTDEELTAKITTNATIHTTRCNATEHGAVACWHQLDVMKVARPEAFCFCAGKGHSLISCKLSEYFTTKTAEDKMHLDLLVSIVRFVSQLRRKGGYDMDGRSHCL